MKSPSQHHSPLTEAASLTLPAPLVQSSACNCSCLDNLGDPVSFRYFLSLAKFVHCLKVTAFFYSRGSWLAPTSIPSSPLPFSSLLPAALLSLIDFFFQRHSLFYFNYYLLLSAMLNCCVTSILPGSSLSRGLKN